MFLKNGESLTLDIFVAAQLSIANPCQPVARTEMDGGLRWLSPTFGGDGDEDGDLGPVLADLLLGRQALVLQLDPARLLERRDLGLGLAARP